MRFKPTLELYSTLTQIAADFESDYPEWQSNNNPKRITMQNPDSMIAARFANGSISFTDEGEGSLGLEKIALRLSGILHEKFHIQEYARIGGRDIFIYETELIFPKLVEAFQHRYYAGEMEMLKGVVDEITDTSLTIEAIKSSLPSRITMGPMQPNEAVERFDSMFEKSRGPLSQKKSYLYVDTDVWQVEPEPAEVQQLTKDVLSVTLALNEQLAEQF